MSISSRRIATAAAQLTRRHFTKLTSTALLAPAILRTHVARADDDSSGPAYANITGLMPSLSFNMALSSTGAPVTAASFLGHPVILYFGFTRCADTCPLTMENAARLVRQMGAAGQNLRILFTTIDPAYDTQARLKAFLANFGPPPVFQGLYGSNAQLAPLAKSYGVQYSTVTNANAPDPVANITHSDAVFGFAPNGQARYILGTLAAPKPNLTLAAQLVSKMAAS